MSARAVVASPDTHEPNLTNYGRPVRVSLTAHANPEFDPSGWHRSSVLVRVCAFSCNFRDRGLLLRRRGSSTARSSTSSSDHDHASVR